MRTAFKCFVLILIWAATLTLTYWLIPVMQLPGYSPTGILIFFIWLGAIILTGFLSTEKD